MAHLREETLNAYLALLLDNYEGIEATAERRTPTEAIDITVVHGTDMASIPILIEAKIGDTSAKRRDAARDARSRLDSGAAGSLAFGLCYPAHLRDGAVSAQATKNALTEAVIAFAPVERSGREPMSARSLASASTPASRHPIRTRPGCSCGSCESSWNAVAGRRSLLSKRASPDPGGARRETVYSTLRGGAR